MHIDGYGVRPFRAEDLAGFVAYRRLPDVAAYQSWTSEYSEHDARALLDAQDSWTFPPPGEWMQFAVTDAVGTLLGDVAVHTLDGQPDSYELGVTMDPVAQGRGVATAVLGAVLAHLMNERGAHRVFATNDARNEPVRRLFGRIGLRHEGTAIEADWFKGEWTTVETWALLAREWAGQETGASRSSSS